MWEINGYSFLQAKIMIDRLNYTAPINCSLNITGRCNLKCLHCSANAANNYTRDMTTEQLYQVVDILVNRAKIFNVYLSGGEPLIRKEFFDIVARFENNGVSVVVFTNATLITEDIAQRFAEETKIKKINTSLDGASSKSHDALRGEGSFKKVIKGINNLLQKGITPHVNCTVSRLNLKELRKITILARNLGIHISFGQARCLGRAALNQDLFNFTKKEMDDIFDNVLSIAQEFRHVGGGPVLEWPRLKAQKYSQSKLRKKPDNHLAFCDICKECITITPDGWVVPCNNFWEYKIGNVLKEDIISIYHSKKAEKVRNLRQLTSKCMDGCNDCPYIEVCSGGCRADAYAQTGSLTGPDKFRCLAHYFSLKEHDRILPVKCKCNK